VFQKHTLFDWSIKHLCVCRSLELPRKMHIGGIWLSIGNPRWSLLTSASSSSLSKSTYKWNIWWCKMLIKNMIFFSLIVSTETYLIEPPPSLSFGNALSHHTIFCKMDDIRYISIFFQAKYLQVVSQISFMIYFQHPIWSPVTFYLKSSSFLRKLFLIFSHC